MFTTKCLTAKTVYHLDVQNDNNNEQKFYLGMFETLFKKHLGNHKNNIPIVNTKIAQTCLSIFGI